jgi:spore germination protein KA
MVIVVAITAISSFVIPSYTMALPIRLLRFAFMGLAAMFGVYGLTIGLILLLVHLNGLHSFGVPYMRPLANYNSAKQRDAILRFPFGTKRTGRK